MTKNQIGKFAVGYPYPTEWVEIVLERCKFDVERANVILSSQSRTEEMVQIQQRKEANQTKTTDGITDCCGYDFGLEQYNKRIRFCPICGKRIIN